MENNNKRKINIALFDKTLRQIEKTLQDLGEKTDSKEGFKISDKPKEDFKINDKPKEDFKINDKLKEDFKINDKPQVEPVKNLSEEHKIDSSHLRMEELHSFNAAKEIKNKSSLGFYTYLALVIGIIFAIYEILNASKISIISKYPASELYIEYFYEIIEILAYVVMNMISFIKNLF